MAEFICQYCDKRLSSQGSLLNHLSGAKYCIRNRVEEEIKLEIEYKAEVQDVNDFTCHGCNKELSSRQSLIRHQNKCVQYVEKYYESKTQHIEKSYDKYINSKIQSITNSHERMIDSYEKTIKSYEKKIES